VVRALTDAGEGPARIGIVTPRKLGGAVVRNRVRRRVREVLRTHQEQLPEGSWIVIYPKRGLENAAFETLRDSLLDALESALKESR
jgi:ribonuclease P protein component